MEQGNIHNVVRVLRVEMIKAQRSKTIDGNIYLFHVSFQVHFYSRSCLYRV